MGHRIAVLTGGSSAERDVALAGAAQVVEALRETGNDVVVVDTAHGRLDATREQEMLRVEVGPTPPEDHVLRELRNLEQQTRATTLPVLAESDLVFVILHGDQGEGGVIQAMLEHEGIRFTGADMVGSVLAMDKDISKRVFLHAGVHTARWKMNPALDPEIERLGFPLVVKPSRVGSTLGLTVVKAASELEAAIELALKYDRDVLLEEYVPGREFTVGILGEDALAVGEIVPSHDVFDYECKYTPGMTDEIFPADIPEDLAAALQAEALAAHRALKLRDFSRVDFRVTDEGEIFCLEANTLPGLTATSLLPQSAAAVGIDFPSLCQRICEMTLQR